MSDFNSKKTIIVNLDSEDMARWAQVVLVDGLQFKEIKDQQLKAVYERFVSKFCEIQDRYKEFTFVTVNKPLFDELCALRMFDYYVVVAYLRDADEETKKMAKFVAKCFKDAIKIDKK